MNLVRALAADLRDLAVDLGANAYTRETLALLESDLYRQVPSALGATITLTDRDTRSFPVRINLLRAPVSPYEIAAALMVPLEIASPAAGRVTFYARKEAAFDELAVTLAEVLDLDRGAIDPHPELPTSTLVPGVFGLMDFSVVNRAVGVLINRGSSLSAARVELHRRATESETDLPTAAQAILDSLV